MVVTDDAGAVTYDEGDDYRVTGAGIVPVAGGGIGSAAAIKVSYSSVSYTHLTLPTIYSV